MDSSGNICLNKAMPSLSSPEATGFKCTESSKESSASPESLVTAVAFVLFGVDVVVVVVISYAIMEEWEWT